MRYRYCSYYREDRNAEGRILRTSGYIEDLLFPLANPDVDSADHKSSVNRDLYNEAAMNNLINESPVLHQALLRNKNTAFILVKQW